MNTTSWGRTLGVLAAAGVLCVGACAERAGKPAPGTVATYRAHDGRVVRYEIAPEAKLQDFAVEAAGGRTIVRLTTGAPISAKGGPLAIDVHFSDHREVAFVRNFTYPSPAPFKEAAVLDARTGAVLGEVRVTVDGRRLELAFDSKLVTGQPRVAITRYLPSREALAEAEGGLEEAYADVRMYGSSNTMHSATPFAGARRATTFSPPPGTTNFNPTTPVIQIPSGSSTIDVVDHDSDWPRDGDYDTGFKDSCGDAILCSWFTWTARISFVGGCGADRDDDGRLDGNEVQSYFGYCAFPSAMNHTWQSRSGAVHWRNVGRADDDGKVYEYIANPTTGKVWVWYSEDRGATWDFLYEGPGRGGAGGWQFFPAPPPGPSPCVTAARP